MDEVIHVLVERLPLVRRPRVLRRRGWRSLRLLILLALRAEVAHSAILVLDFLLHPAGDIIGEGLLTHCRLRVEGDTLADEGLLRGRLLISVSSAAWLGLDELLLLETPVHG